MITDDLWAMVAAIEFGKDVEHVDKSDRNFVKMKYFGFMNATLEEQFKFTHWVEVVYRAMTTRELISPVWGRSDDCECSRATFIAVIELCLSRGMCVGYLKDGGEYELKRRFPIGTHVAVLGTYSYHVCGRFNRRFGGRCEP